MRRSAFRQNGIFLYLHLTLLQKLLADLIEVHIYQIEGNLTGKSKYHMKDARVQPNEYVYHQFYKVDHVHDVQIYDEHSAGQKPER